MQDNIEQRVRARLAINKAAKYWLYDPNVSMIDYGWAEHQGRIADDENPVIRVHVRKKFYGEARLEEAIQTGVTRARIGDTIDGFKVDRPEGNYVLHQGIEAAQVKSRRIANSPMQGGISISRSQGSYATLGALVTDRNTCEPMILSNAHVLAGRFGARPGQFIYQPGRLDGGRYKDLVATYTRDVMYSHHLDAAVARLTGSRKLVNHQAGIGKIKGVNTTDRGMEVSKSGRRTGVTTGRVTGVGGVAKIYFSGMTWVVYGVITIDSIGGGELSAGGDSGSIWLDQATKKAVGLHFAGYNNPERALAIDINKVLDALDVDLVSS